MDLGPLEDDFAALDRDLASIAAMPLSLGRAGTEMFDAMMKSGAQTTKDAPLGDAFMTAIHGMMRDSATTDLHGNTQVKIDQRALLEHGAPVMRDMVSALETSVEAMLGDIGVGAVPGTGAPGEPKKNVKVKVDLMSIFSGLLEQAVEKSKKKPKG